MSFYLDRLEAAQRQRVMAEAAAAHAHAPPPRAWNCYQYRYRHAALLPRPPRHPPPPPPAPPLHAGGVGEVRGGGRDTLWRGCSVAPVGAGAAGANAFAASGAGGQVGVGARGVAGSVAPAPAPAREDAGGGVAVARSEVAPISATAGAGAAARGAGGLPGGMSSSMAPAREDAGSVGADGQVRNKRCLLVAPTPDARGPPPKRRAVSARRRFPPGCGRDAAAAVPLPVSSAVDDGSRSVPARSGALQESPPPPPTTLAGGKDSILFEAAASPRVPAAAGSSALNKVSAADGAAGATSDGAHHCTGAAAMVKLKPPEAPGPGKNSAAAPDALCNATGSHSQCVAGLAGGSQQLKNRDCLLPSVRSLPKPGMVSAYRRFPPGCGRREATRPAGGGSSQVCLQASSPEAVATDRDAMEIVAPEIQQSPRATLHDEAASRRHGTSAPGISAVEAYASHVSSSDEEMIGNTWRCEDNKSGGSYCDVVAESLAQGRIKEHLGSESVSECATTTDMASPGVAAGMSGEGATMRKKVMLTPRKSVRPPKSIQNSALNTQCRTLSKEAKEAELGRSTQMCLMPSEVEVAAGRCVMETVSPPCSGAADGHGLEEGKAKASPEVQEPPSDTVHDEATACAPVLTAMEVAYASHASSEERIGNTWQCDENKSGGSSCDVVSETLAHGLPDEHLSGERVSECATPDTAWSGSGVAAGVPGQGAMLRKKVMLTPRKSVKRPKSIQKPALNTQRRPFSKEAEEMTELGIGRHAKNGIQASDEFTKYPAMQDPMYSDKCRWTKGKVAATIGDYYFGPKMKVKVKGAKLEDGDIFKAIAVNEGKFEYGPQNSDARSKVKMICSKFESICKAIVQAVDQRSLKVRRIDLAADKLIRKLPGFTKLGPIVGAVPGVEIGDEFLYRVELALVGLHRPYQGGIDTTRDKHGALIAISVVASGGYPDESSCSGELIYTGSGKKGDGDQKLQHGNLALKNCIERKTPVRVIHGFKGLNREGVSHSRAREVSTFAYDGLYHVVECWKEGRPGSKVFKYKLQRIPGQSGPSLHMAKFVRKNSMRPGFISTCMPAIPMLTCFHHLLSFLSA